MQENWSGFLCMTSSQCFIHVQNKHKWREIAFFFCRMPDSCMDVLDEATKVTQKWQSFALNALF